MNKDIPVYACKISGRISAKHKKQMLPKYIKLYLCLAGLIFSILLFNCAQAKSFGQLPYSVQVDSYEYIEEAEQTAGRLKALKFNAFIVKRVNAAGDFSMDLCVGVFRTAAQAKKTEEKLKAQGLKQAQVIVYDKVKDDIEEFKKLNEKEKKNFRLPGTGIPQLPEAIIDMLSLFPVDEYFRILSLKIEDCAYNLGKVTGRNLFRFNGELLPPGLMLDKIQEQAVAMVQAVYEDSLYHYRFSMLAVQLKNTTLISEGLLTHKELGKVKQSMLAYPARASVFSGNLYERIILSAEKEQQYSFLAYDPGTNYLIIIDTSDCPLAVLRSLIKKGAAPSGLLAFSQIRENLILLPAWADTDLPIFSGFSLDKVTAEFAAERSNSDWAQSVVGNYRSRGYYVIDKDCFIVSVFDLNFSRTAFNVFTVFTANNEELQTGTPQPVLDKEGWYEDTPGFTELSFVHGSFIIALNYLTYMDWDNEFYYEIYRRFNTEKTIRLNLMKQYAGKLQIGSVPAIAPGASPDPEI